MKVIGIVGGIGAGKSTVVALMQQLYQVHAISADSIGHDILLKGHAAYEPIIKAFGREILDEQEEIVRKRLAKLVFEDEQALNRLNSITHPLIEKEIKRQIHYYKEITPKGYVILEAALLIESGLINLTELVIAVYADVALRTSRVIVRDNIDEEAVKSRVAAQKQWEEIKHVADYIIDNSISLEDTKNQIQHIMKEVQEEERR